MSDLAMFAEHSHRLSAGLMSLITFAIAVGIWVRDPRIWLRRLALFAAGLVLAQALVGGLRVLFDHLHIETVNTSVGRVFAMAHACLAQVYVCNLLALSLALSRPWIETAGSGPDAVRRFSWQPLALICCGLLLLQLAIAAVMRHSFAGLAIGSFPWSTPAGGLLPESWDFRVGIHFAHRVMAIVLTIALVALAVRIGRDSSSSRGIRLSAYSLVLLVGVQIALGAASVLTYRNPYYTTAHVIVGAVTLATCFGLTWWSYRGRIEATNAKEPGPLRPTPAYANA